MRKKALIETQSEKPPSGMCCQWRLKSVQSTQSLCCLLEETASLAIQNVPNEVSDQTAQMRRLILIFPGCICPKVRFLILWLVLCNVSEKHESYCIIREIVKEEYLVIILGYFFLFLHENICCGYSLEVLAKTLLMSTNSICFYGELEKGKRYTQGLP